jgi:isoleucyl-tRNA synthetase
LRASGSTSLLVEGEPIAVGTDEVIVTQTPRAGWSVATEAGDTVALDLTMTPELRREGLAREVIRLVQDARKADGLDVSDRILFWWDSSDSDLAEALAEHGALIASEVLAEQFRRGHPGDGETAGAASPVRDHTADDLALTFHLQRA